MISTLCMPALIYAVYATSHVVIDLYRGLYNTAFVECIIGILFTLTLNMLCFKGFTAMSWIIVSIPFILMTAVAGILLFAFGLNPATGKTMYSTAPVAQEEPIMINQPLPLKQPAPIASSTPAPPSQPSPYAMPLTVRIESFTGRPGNSNLM